MYYTTKRYEYAYNTLLYYVQRVGKNKKNRQQSKPTFAVRARVHETITAVRLIIFSLRTPKRACMKLII